MTLAELKRVEVRYRNAAARAEALRLERNAAILATLAAGRTHAEVAAELGLTRGRVGQIAQTVDRTAA